MTEAVQLSIALVGTIIGTLIGTIIGKTAESDYPDYQDI